MVSIKMGSLILYTLTAHYKPNFTLCNGTFWNNIWFSAAQYPLFWGFTYPNFIAKQNECEICSSTLHLMKVPGH